MAEYEVSVGGLDSPIRWCKRDGLGWKQNLEITPAENACSCTRHESRYTLSLVFTTHFVPLRQTKKSYAIVIEPYRVSRFFYSMPAASSPLQPKSHSR